MHTPADVERRPSALREESASRKEKRFARGSWGTSPFGKDKTGQALWEGQERTGRDFGGSEKKMSENLQKRSKSIKLATLAVRDVKIRDQHEETIQNHPMPSSIDSKKYGFIAIFTIYVKNVKNQFRLDGSTRNFMIRSSIIVKIA